MRRFVLALAVAAAAAGGAQAQAPSAEQQALRGIYEELVEIDTSVATGSCTPAAEAMAAHLRAAGFGADDVQVIAPPDRPDDGNLVAVLRGSSRQRALLLLAHIDVVNANRADWERDPFTLIEEDGFFYGRGAADDKAMAAIFVDMLAQMKRENYRPRRSIKLALTCGEETPERFNGVQYLLANHRAWLEADFALNEGAGGQLSADGTPIALNIQAGEKSYKNFKLVVTNPGGHSSRPVPDNAIYRLAAGLGRLSQHRFPVELNPVTRAYFARMAPIVGGDIGAAMTALAADPADGAAAARVAQDPSYNAIMRTTCVATQLAAGHAPNALPQRAEANVNCRVLQGHSAEEIRDELVRVLADAQISVIIDAPGETTQAPRLSSEILGPVERAAAAMWPGVPVAPSMAAGATDGRFLIAAGIPTYGVSGIFSVPGEANAHGLNEKLRVRSLYEGRAFLERIVRAYARR